MHILSQSRTSPSKFLRHVTKKQITADTHQVGKEGRTKTKASHFTPVWIVLTFLIPCLGLTVYYAKYGVTGSWEIGSILPSPSYALVLFLVYLDSVGLVALTLLLSRNLLRAYFEKRHRLLGSGFRTKLIAAFIGFSLIPTVMLATVASGVISKMMESWFNDQMMQVLNNSADIVELHKENRMALASNSAQAIAEEIFREDNLKPERRELLRSILARKRQEFDLAGVEVFSSKMETLARMIQPDLSGMMLKLPIQQFVLQTIDAQKPLTFHQAVPSGKKFLSGGQLIRATAPIAANTPSITFAGVVVVSTFVPEMILGKMESITHQNQEYGQIKALKDPIMAGAYLFVAAVTVLILFGATWFGFYVAKGITVPIQRLAEGTEAVAKGNLDVNITVKAADEIGTLVDSFNRMTGDLRQGKWQLEEANQSLRQSNLELDRRRAYTQAVVDTIASGVLSIDKDGTISTFNPSAERIIGVSGEQFRGRPVTEALKEFGLTLFQEAYDRILADGQESLSLEGQMEGQGKLLTIGLNLSRMRNETGKDLGFVLVFEDRTELLKAQKVAAWQEVAQRIAHEIKNPLTPIKLSAQRLRKKFFEGSVGLENILDQATKVIVSEVDSLKAMVDEFSKFARMPTPQMKSGSLHAIIEQVVSLYTGAHRDLKFLVSFDETMPSITCDHEQLKRVFVNLFDNAGQAMNYAGRVWVTTECDRTRRHAIIRVGDEGPGIRREDQDKLFLPYFSKKRSGTGLGLAIVHRVITDHNGSIRVEPRHPHGTLFTFELPM